MTYNGWTNRETWLVNLWIGNEEGSYRYWREEALRHWNRAMEDHADDPKQHAKQDLADQLKEEITDQAPTVTADLYADLMDCALCEIDWWEIADHLLTEFAEQTTAPEKNADRVERLAGVSFPLGLLVATPGALDRVPHEERLIALGRHADGDWGDCCPEDWHSNNLALVDGLRLFSVYHTLGGAKFWIITEADRSVTTILLPEEY